MNVNDAANTAIFEDRCNTNVEQNSAIELVMIESYGYLQCWKSHNNSKGEYTGDFGLRPLVYVYTICTSLCARVWDMMLGMVVERNELQVLSFLCGQHALTESRGFIFRFEG